MTSKGGDDEAKADGIEDVDVEDEQEDFRGSEDEDSVKSAENKEDAWNLEITRDLISTLETTYRRALEESYWPRSIFRSLVLDIEKIHWQFCSLYRSNLKPESFSDLEDLFYTIAKKLIKSCNEAVYGSQPAKVCYLYALTDFAASKKKGERHYAWTRERLNEFLDLCTLITRYEGSPSEPTSCAERYILATCSRVPQQLLNPDHSLLTKLLLRHINARSPCKLEALGLLRAASKSPNTAPLLSRTLPTVTKKILSEFPSPEDFNLLPTIYLTILPKADPSNAQVRQGCLELLRDRIFESIVEMETNPDDEEMSNLNTSLESFYKTRGIEVLAQHLDRIPIPLVFILFCCLDLVDDEDGKLKELNASLLEVVDAQVAFQLLSLWGVLVPISFRQLDKGERAWNWVMSERMKLNQRIQSKL